MSAHINDHEAMVVKVESERSDKDAQEFAFSAYDSEPILKWLMRLRIKKCSFTPVTLGLAFLTFISLPLTIWGAYSGPYWEGYLSYIENVSWSVSMLFIFPFLVGLTLQYYREIPQLFKDLLARSAPTPKGQSHREFIAWLTWWLNLPAVSIFFALLALGLNFIYFLQLLNIQNSSGWMVGGTIGKDFFLGSAYGLTPLGLFAAIIQVVLTYWVLGILWRGAVMAWGLQVAFRDFEIPVEPLHPDGACGLSSIGRVSMLLNIILFLIGLYLSLKVIDKIVIQNRSLLSDIGNPVMLAGYLIISPALFFFALGAAHRKMKEKKETLLLPLGKRCCQLMDEIGQPGASDAALSGLKEALLIRNGLRRDVPVWPFDFRSVRAFMATIVAPLLPVLLPFFLKYLFGNG